MHAHQLGCDVETHGTSVLLPVQFLMSEVWDDDSDDVITKSADDFVGSAFVRWVPLGRTFLLPATLALLVSVI